MSETVNLDDFMTVRVTLDITVRRATRDDPASWDFHRMLLIDDRNDALAVVSTDEIEVDQGAVTAMTEAGPDELPDDYRMSEAMRAFLEGEIANERQGGVSPATLESADDTLTQLNVYELLGDLEFDDEEFFREFEQLIGHYGPDGDLRHILAEHPQPQEA